MRVFKAGGVEIFNEDVQYIKDGDILFASFGEDFDESSNFALYKMIRSLGEGGYGKVFEAKNRLTKEKVAIKLIDCSKICKLLLLILLFSSQIHFKKMQKKQK